MGVRDDMALAISHNRGMRSDYRLAQGKFLLFTDDPKIVLADTLHDKLVAKNFRDTREANISALSLSALKFGALYVFTDYANNVMVAFKESPNDEEEFVSKTLMYLPLEELVKIMSLPYIQKCNRNKALLRARMEGIL